MQVIDLNFHIFVGCINIFNFKKTNKMIKQFTLFTLFLFLTAILLTGQPVITSTEGNPQIGDMYEVATSSLASGMQGPSGANVTWDFSTIAENAVNTIEFVDPATTGFGATFPDADVAFGQGGSWDMLNVTNDTTSRVGVVQQGFAIPYSDMQNQYFWPMTYGSTNSDFFAATWVNSGITFNRAGTINSEIDGYGDLTLPWGIVEDVLRVKLTEVYQDTYTGGGMIDYDSEIYIWYKEGIHYPIMSLSTINVSGSPNTFSSFMKGSSVGIFNPPTIFDNVNVFPNPTSSFTTLSIEIKEKKQVKISVIDLLGREILPVNNSTLSVGEHDFTIDLSGIEKGIYLIKSEVDGGINTQRLILK